MSIMGTKLTIAEEEIYRDLQQSVIDLSKELAVERRIRKAFGKGLKKLIGRDRVLDIKKRAKKRAEFYQREKEGVK